MSGMSWEHEDELMGCFPLLRVTRKETLHLLSYWTRLGASSLPDGWMATSMECLGMRCLGALAS